MHSEQEEDKEVSKIDKKELKNKLKKTPESIVERWIKLVGLRDRQRDIALLRCCEHKSVDEICEILAISESTYHREFELILIKINTILEDSIELNKSNSFL